MRSPRISSFRVKAANDEHRETMEVSVQMQLLARST